MDSGYYTSAVGMMTDFTVESQVTDNMSNQNTPGFRERTAVLGDFQQELLRAQAPGEALAAGSGEVALGSLATAPQVQRFGLNLAQGAPRYTGNPLDMSVIGNGFFTVRAGGQTLLTRNGSFHRGADGTLLAGAGYPVLGAGGRPLRVPNGTISVAHDGTVSVDGRTAGRLALATVPVGRPLTETTPGYYAGPGQPVTAGNGTVAIAQGYLEGSNVDLATEMTRLMSAQRSYQANAQLLQMQDQTIGLAANDLGKV